MAKLKMKGGTCISQAKLRRYVELKKLVEEFNGLKEEIAEMCKAGTPCQPGPLSAHLKITPTTNIPWAAEFESHCGKGVLEEVKKQYYKNGERRSLEVIDRKETVS